MESTRSTMTPWMMYPLFFYCHAFVDLSMMVRCLLLLMHDYRKQKARFVNMKFLLREIVWLKIQKVTLIIGNSAQLVA